MNKYMISINDLPPAGKEFFLDDQQIWLEPLREFKMDCRMEKPLSTRIFVMATDDGCLVRGQIEGGVILPCNRCTEDAHVDIESKFDEFEEIPENDLHNPAVGEGHIVFEKNAPMLNLAEVAWEQFMLSLPTRPLCREDCKGLCAKCGANLNLGACDCVQEEGDPRMAALRNLKIGK